MKAKKQNSLKTREKVLKALSTSSLHKLTADEILMALKEDGVESLKGLVTRLTKTIRDSADLSPQSLRRISLQLLSRQTPKKPDSTIVHRVPKLSFVLDGTQYDPKDIRRFNGRELHFVVGSQSAPRNALLAFEDRNILTNWLQIISLSKFAGLNVASTSPSQSSDLGILVHGGEHGPNPPGSAAVYPRPLQGDPQSGVYYEDGTVDEVQMFEAAGYQGLGLRLSRGSEFPNLTWVKRSQLLHWQTDWNDAISSIYPTTNLCAYFEHVDFDGAIRIVCPNIGVSDLDWIGFNKIISSVKNLG
jgi:hypothetical protein